MKILLLGSTGSIGTSTCNCVKRFPEAFQITGLSANKNTCKLLEQLSEFSSQAVCIGDEEIAEKVRTEISSDVQFFSGKDGLCTMVRELEYDVLLNALVGAAGFLPTVEALRRGKRVALANKESLVIGGDCIAQILKEGSGSLIPVDSEHSAIFQCLQGEKMETVESIILTASGGPFRELAMEKFADITPEDALNHPTWEMGPKITIDSATLINKGFEVIEAHYLFGLSYAQIRVWIHPQSIIHSMVEFHDGAVLAQLGVPDMELPIQYALSFPERMPLNEKRLSLTQAKSLTFMEPDYTRFPCLKLCREAGEAGGTVPAVLNAANEMAVKLFLEKKIRFDQIARIIESAIEEHVRQDAFDPAVVEETDRQTRENVMSKLVKE